MGKLNIGLIAKVLAVVVGLCLVFLAVYLAVPDTHKLEDILGIAQAFVTILAIVVGGIFAAYKWEVFREFKPLLTLTHDDSNGPSASATSTLA